MRYLIRPHFALLFALAALQAALFAAPSGGPYGPIQQSYEIPAEGAVFYVSPDGDERSEGASIESPTTLENAIAQASTGDAIVLRGGDYRVGSLRLSQGIVLQPYQSERPVLKGTRIARDWVEVGDGLWRTDWDTLFPAQPADWWRRERNVQRTPLHRFNNDMVFIDGQRLLSAGSLEELSEGVFFIDYLEGTVTIAQDPSGKTIEITAHNSALTRTMRAAHGKANDGIGPTIRGITFTQYARLALEIEGIEPGEYTSPENFGKEVVGATLEHLTISHCSRVAGYFRGDNLTIRNCLISDCGTEGIYVINSADLLLERNIVTRTNSHEQFSGYYASSVKIFNQSYNAVCRDNLIIDNPHASGIWYDVGNVDGLVVDNWFQNTNDGFFFEISKGAIAMGNVFVNCSPGSRVLNSSGVKLYQNTYYNSRAEFIRTERSHTAGDHFGWHASSGPDVEERHSHAFINNLLHADNHFEESLVAFFETPGVTERVETPQLEAMNGNVYARTSSRGEQPLFALSSANADEPFRPVHGLVELRNEYPSFEDAGVELLDYWGPLFKSKELLNFELLSDFPAAEHGAELPASAQNLWRKQPSPAFPGAYPPR
ncbi:right-handed parallel beta-helix repeat-containing protein [Pelagicoccus sp. SDUM812003]|uniref:right-handed parallel beta-helix repeat-containing protein n=1 Tax=Pelagicoccus sp. SDUM812003 TaxID=3041267 RepID=UPI00280C6670|nr:right-handed parallel beta-helix repeat-containing protein [Pelagicoccus sp. SDUM812003]MDQ8203951.1 right-handed parallel beta-helix repeat-containing protein [Pelagicoccus sp. SDUM812003]